MISDYPITSPETYAWMQVVAKTEAVQECVNPMASAAVSIQKLSNPSVALDKDTVHNELKAKAEKIESGNLSDVEKMLAAQAQMLHVIFADAMERYADKAAPERTQLYGGIALKAQSLCRLTVTALAKMKKPQPLPPQPLPPFPLTLPGNIPPRGTNYYQGR